MKLKTIVIVEALILVLMARIPAGAKVIPPRPFFFDREITVNGAVVPEGMYSLSVKTHRSVARATLRKDGRFIATAHGAWVAHGVKYPENAVLLRVNADGTRTLMEIRFAGSTKSIVIDGERQFLRVSPAPAAVPKPAAETRD